MRNADKGPVTDSQAVELAIEAIVSDPDETKSRSKNESKFFQIRAALALGYHEPLTPEQRAMNTILTQLEAGKASTEKAWDIYHKLRSDVHPPNT